MKESRLEEAITKLLEEKPFDTNQKDKEALYSSLMPAIHQHHLSECEAYCHIWHHLGHVEGSQKTDIQNFWNFAPLPVGLFKKYLLSSISQDEIYKILASSGTTGNSPSRVPLNRQTAERIEAIYRFFCRKGFYAQQYIPCLDPLGEQRGKQSYSLTPAVFESVMKKLFDLWYADQMSGVPVYIRQFENYVEMLAGGQPEACSMYGKCSMQNVIESDGTVYPCDFYALDAWAMGNIKDPALDFVKLWQWSVSEHPAPFFRESAKRDARCSGCRWYPLCRGGCRRDCETEKEGFRNVYCEAYQNFFAHSIGRLERLTALRRHFPYGI